MLEAIQSHLLSRKHSCPIILCIEKHFKIKHLCALCTYVTKAIITVLLLLNHFFCVFFSLIFFFFYEACAWFCKQKKSCAFDRSTSSPLPNIEWSIFCTRTALARCSPTHRWRMCYHLSLHLLQASY